MNNKGFTLVELLAAMIVLGLMMAVVIPNIVGILNNNKTVVFIEDSKKMVETLKLRRSTHINDDAAKDDRDVLETQKKCIYYSLAYLDNSEFSEPPNGGCYDIDSSYVILCSNVSNPGAANEFFEDVYYVQLKEVKGTKTYGIPIKEYTNAPLTKNDVKESGFIGNKSDLGSDTAVFNLTSNVEIDGKKIGKVYLYNGAKRYKNPKDADGICSVSTPAAP